MKELYICLCLLFVGLFYSDCSISRNKFVNNAAFYECLKTAPVCFCCYFFYLFLLLINV